jgi:hypothetical protein
MNDIFESFGIIFPQHWSSSTNDDGRTSNRWLQPPNIPNYTSPPLPDAIQATPEAYRSDEVIDAARAAAAAGNCSAATDDGNRCHIPFSPPSELFDPEGDDPSKVGVIFYGGALVDPRAYSPIAHVRPRPIHQTKKWYCLTHP